MVESELLVSRLRVRRFVAIAVIVLAVVSVIVTGYGLHARSQAREAHTERIRVLSADVKSIEKGVRSDAAALVAAFDDAEAESLLAEQSGVWADRVQRCSRLQADLTTLVPGTSAQTQKQMEIQALLAKLATVSRDISSSASSRDVDSARAAARSIAPKSNDDDDAP